MKNFQNFGVVELSTVEKSEINGGEMPGWVKNLGIGYAIQQVIDHWDEIKKGFAEGWEAGK